MPGMRFTPNHCELLARYQHSKPWNVAEESDQGFVESLEERRN
jgi:hypothetical protein